MTLQEIEPRSPDCEADDPYYTYHHASERNLGL